MNEVPSRQRIILWCANDMNWETILHDEFSAEDGSYLLQLRTELVWDRQAFRRLEQAMYACVRDHEGSEVLARWIGEGFWYLSFFVKEWSSHPNFRKDYEPAYYQKAYQHLDDLASWLFSGANPYMPSYQWEPL